MTLMSDVLGKLLSELALQSMQFSVSPDSKNQQDEKLIDKALQAFENRAQQVVKKLGRNNYKIVDIVKLHQKMSQKQPIFALIFDPASEP
jgi:predicted secreted protein